MSRILGLWNRDGSPVSRELFAAMAKTLQHAGHDPVSFHHQGPLALGCVNLRVTPEAQSERQPYGQDDLGIVFDGRLDNRDELITLLPSFAPERPDCELVLALYQEKGTEAFARLIGDFAFAIFDSHQRRLLLVRDGIGMRPLHYATVGAAFIFASEFKAILAHPSAPREPNREALAWFLLRHPATDLKGATFFKQIHSVRPGYFVEVTADTVRERQFWDFDTAKRIRFNSEAEYSEAFAEIFHRAVKNRMRSAHPVSLCVSGGLDSSAVMCSAANLEARRLLRPITHTFNPGTAADEEAFIGEVEKHTGISVERFRTPLGFRENMHSAMWQGEAPILNEMANCHAELFRRIAASGAKSYLTGLWGDQVLFDYSYLTSLFWRGRWGTVKQHLRACADWYPEVGYEHFQRELAKTVLRSAVPNPLLNELRKLRVRRGTSRPHSWFYTEQFRRTRTPFDHERRGPRDFASRHARSLYYIARSGAYLIQMELGNKVAAAHGLDHATPFLDREVIQFLMSIPGEIANRNGVPKAILRDAMKDVLPPAIATRRTKADGTEIANQAMHEAFPDLAKLLGERCQVLSRGYLETKVMERLLDSRGRIVASDCQLTFELSELFGLELWLRSFFDDTSHVARERSRASGVRG